MYIEQGSPITTQQGCNNMAYQTGTVSSLTDIQTTIQAFLVANGWTWDVGSSTIHKDSMFIGFITTTDKALFQARASLGSSPVAQSVGVGRINVSGAPFGTLALTFPATYWMFLSNDEFYFVINYEVTRYQYVTWGKSTIDVGSATGTFTSGTVNSSSSLSASYSTIAISPSSGGANGWWGYKSTAPFWDTALTVSDTNLTSDFVHTNINGDSWILHNGATNQVSIGVTHSSNLISTLPNSWNGESPLLPIRAYKRMPESKISLVLDLQNARYCRMDNFNDKEIISIGTDEWQIFPFHRRNMSLRDGDTGIDHTGTFGWAIRKVD